MGRTSFITVTILLLVLCAAAPLRADERPTPPPQQTAWAQRPHRVMAGISYPAVLDIRYSYAVLPRVRAGVAFIGFGPFLFGGAIQGDFMLFEVRSGKNGFVTGSAGLQALFLKYNFGIAGIQPNDVDWGVGPEFAIDVGVSWFSAGFGVGLLVGDWRSLKRDIASDITPGENLVITFTAPRLAVSW